MRQIKWSNDALDDFARNLAYIAKDSPTAAIITADRLNEAAISLGTRPTGRPGRHEDVYEKSVHKTSYIIAYALSDTTVTILRIIHSAQNWTSQDWPKP
jgi:plasmid stabilization system protein ParE